MKRQLWVWIALIVVMIAAACTPAAPAQPTSTTPPQGGPATPTAETGKETEAMEQARMSAVKALAEKLGLSEGEIEVQAVEAVDFNDSCLGLGGPAESCLQVITPGYRLTLTAGGQTYEVRVAADGSTARVAEPAQTGGQGEAAALAQAAAALAQRLGALPAQVKLVKTEAVDWPDSCLGLGGPDEMCAQAVTPGYRFTLEVDGKQYEVRTDAAGTYARVNEQSLGNVTPGPLAGPFAKAIEVLAQQAGVSPREVRLVDASAEEWPDGCLGLGRPDEGCLLAITPGYRLVLEVDGKQYEVRTDQKGSQVRVAGPNLGGGGSMPQDHPTDLILLTWRREGGIAGLCDELTVYAGGDVEAASCKGGAPAAVGSFQMSAEQQEKLFGWVRSFASFEYIEKDPATADAMTQTLVFTGSGTQPPTQAQQQEIAAFAAELFAQAGKP